jgi:hypothetical protein
MQEMKKWDRLTVGGKATCTGLARSGQELTGCHACCGAGTAEEVVRYV